MPFGSLFGRIVTVLVKFFKSIKPVAFMTGLCMWEACGLGVACYSGTDQVCHTAYQCRLKLAASLTLPRAAVLAIRALGRCFRVSQTLTNVGERVGWFLLGIQMSVWSTAGLVSTWWKIRGSQSRKRVDGMWAKVYLPLVMCSPGLCDEWAGPMQSALFSQGGRKCVGNTTGWADLSELHLYLVYFHFLFIGLSTNQVQS